MILYFKNFCLFLGLRNRKNSEGNKTKKEDLQKIDNYKFELKSEYFIPDKEKVSPVSFDYHFINILIYFMNFKLKIFILNFF